MAQMTGTVLTEVSDTVARPETLPNGQVRFRIRVIEGDIQGSSAYYPASVIERDGAKTWPKGTKMYVDHQSFFEFMEKPAGSLTNLAGVFDADPVFENNELVTYATVFSNWAPMLREMAPFIGVSIRAAAVTEEGPSPIDGEITEIVTELIAGLSVDFVTNPGANGRILEIMESKPEVLPPGAKIVTHNPAIEAGTKKEKGKPMAELTEETLKGFSDNIAALSVVVAGLAAKQEAAAPAGSVVKESDKQDAPDPVELAFTAAPLIAEAKLSPKGLGRVQAAVKAGKPLAEAIADEKALIAEVLAEAEKPGLHVVGSGPAPTGKTSADNPFGLMEADVKVLDKAYGKVAG